MYASSIIERNLDIERARLRRLLGNDFEFKRHTPAECQQARSYFETLVDEGGKLKRDLTKEEIRWISNERALARWDFEYYRSRYYHIEIWENQVILFSPNAAQRIQTKIMAELEEKRVGVEVQNPKARQVGVTTDSECRVAHRVQFRSNINAVVGSSDPGKSALMAQKMDTAWERMPWFLMPRAGPPWNAKQKEFPEQNSAVSIVSGSQFHGVARGQTPTVAHLSELPEWNDPQVDVEDAMLRAMHPNPELFIVLEGTFMQMNDWWDKTWGLTQEGKNRFTGKFYPWYIARELYPTETYLRKFPIPSDWTPLDRTVKYAEKAREYVQSDRHLLLELGSAWLMPREQMWYYEREYSAAAAKHAVNAFLKEMPADPVEMRQVTGLSVFDADVLQSHWESCRQPIAVYGFQAREDIVPLRLQASRDELWTSERANSKRPPDIEIEVGWLQGHEFEIKLVPLKFSGYGNASPEEGLNRLFLWEMPRVGENYGAGLDTSEGIGADRAALEIVRRQSVREYSEQVAEYCSQWANPVDMINITSAVAALFSPPSVSGERHQCKIICERRSESDITQLELRKQGWTNFHHFFHIEDSKADPNRESKLGWFTNVWSRRRILAWMIYNVKQFSTVINSPWLINELKTLHRDESEQKLRAEYGAHDDRVMSYAFTWYCLHELDNRSPGGNLIDLSPPEIGEAVRTFEDVMRRRSLDDASVTDSVSEKESNLVEVY